MSRMHSRPTIQHFGYKLRILRQQHKLTLQQFAETLGYAAHGYISELEAGKKLPTAEFILRISREFGVSTDELLKDELDIPVPFSLKETNPMAIAFIDRDPTPAELEKFRLLLSTFQDGSGMLTKDDGLTLPGWRDFERTVATLLGGKNMENKFIFDVMVSDPEKPVDYGISCKMRGELDRVSRDGRVTIDLSNSSKQFKDHLAEKGIFPDDYRKRPDEVGISIVELIERWKHTADVPESREIDLTRSCYLTLLYNRSGTYQLFWFRVQLPDPQTLRWYYPEIAKGKQVSAAGHLNGDDADGRVFEWYSDSGGQLRYYPLAQDAVWKSPQFTLEPLPHEGRLFGLLAKAERYFPERWKQLSSR